MVDVSIVALAYMQLIIYAVRRLTNSRRVVAYFYRREIILQNGRQIALKMSEQIA
jgi:hypothetical protein